MLNIDQLRADLGYACIKEIDRVTYLCFDASYNLDYNILPNFTLRELLTKNQRDTYTQIALPILYELQIIRNAWGSGVGINSSYRNPSYNKAVGGASRSQHLLSTALDIYPINRDIQGFKSLIKTVKKSGGVGLNYRTFVHIDCRKQYTIF